MYPPKWGDTRHIPNKSGCLKYFARKPGPARRLPCRRRNHLKAILSLGSISLIARLNYYEQRIHPYEWGRKKGGNPMTSNQLVGARGGLALS